MRGSGDQHDVCITSMNDVIDGSYAFPAPPSRPRACIIAPALATAPLPSPPTAKALRNPRPPKALRHQCATWNDERMKQNNSIQHFVIVRRGPPYPMSKERLCTPPTHTHSPRSGLAARPAAAAVTAAPRGGSAL